ncbi:MAG: carbamoyltransferase HypF [Caulobacterales bacterium]|nr:carbamoyltransferase HypF [Caulobacterales bacterium]
MTGGAPTAAVERRRARVRGAVQGVGFRPHVYALAARDRLAGWVRNDAEGVLLEVEGADLDGFFAALRAEAPPLARIDAVEQEAVRPQGAASFEILKSEGGAVATAIGPDAAVCDACLEELFDPGDRRHGYVFLNCTHCGPRYTITRALPYDRANTSMAAFPMCPDCAGEYHDPLDRRFHAQPTACPACGPHMAMAVSEIVARLRAGEILAIKGLGGFHLACDARDEAAVARLRARKDREEKPFAVMTAGLASARRWADIGPAEAELLTSRERPIVLTRRREGSGLAEGVAPGLRELGLILPYAPLHYALFHEAAGKPPGTAWLDEPQALALVMTSANPGGEPLVTGNDEARERLGSIADAIVDHDRAIVVRADDSVMRVTAGAPAFIRRARGHTPAPIRLARSVPPILAVGGHLKNTICLARGEEAFVSQHVGDLDNGQTFRFFTETIDHLSSVLQIAPEIVACDLHPDFLSTRYADETGLPVVRVQHHHAHVASAAAEYGVEGPLLGLALDGFGLGADGGAWGGELIVADGAEFERAGHLAALAQPGGDVAAREPWRMAAAALAAIGRAGDIEARFSDEPHAGGVRAMLERGLNAPETSSCGRLFDAAAGLLGVRARASFEGQAPMLLEGLVRAPRVLEDGWRIADGVLDLRPLLARLTDETDPREGAELFHGTLIAALAAWAGEAAKARGLGHVALTGGCFLNRVIAEGVSDALAARGLTPLSPRAVPPNDGGLSLGQAWVAAQTMLDGKD